MEKYYALQIDYESIKCNCNYLSFYVNPSEKKIYFPICFRFQNHLIIYLHLSIDVSTNVNHIMKQFEFILFKNYSNYFNIQIDIPNSHHIRASKNRRKSIRSSPIEIKQRHSISIPFITQCRSFPRGFPFNTRKLSCADVDRAVTSSVEAYFNALC